MCRHPFTITNKMLNLCISITEKITSINLYNSINRMPVLRKNNKIRSIHSSLLIEANSLSLNQVKDVINGKVVLGDKKEIQEVKNAYKAYEDINKYYPYNESDLLKAHKELTNLLCLDSGRYRNHPEGVFDGNKVIFIAPNESLVPQLMSDLFDWLKNDNDTHILIKSCVFHYEFVFIHPFSDGNGRTVRLWQNVILNSWNNAFEYLPIESQIAENKKEYYDSIAICHNNGNSNVFIEFMLRMIEETLDDVLVSVKKENIGLSDSINRLISLMEDNKTYTSNDLLDLLGIKSKETLRSTYLNIAIENGLILMTIPDKPTSRNQRYYKA